MNTLLTFIISLIYILYNIITLTVINKDQKLWIHLIVGGIIGILSLSALVIYYLNTKETQSNGLFLLLFGLILIIGYIFSLINISNTINDKDIDENEINTLRTKTLVSNLLFTIVGIVSYGINSAWGDCQNINELLCDKNIVLLLIISNIVVYNSINFLKLHGQDWIWTKEEKKEDKENIGMDLGVIIMLMIWQFYIYFLIDGFKGATLSNTPSIPQDKNINVLFNGLSVIVILSLLIYSFVTNAQCKEWKNIKHVNNIKEISYNMLISSIISIIIIGIHVI